MVGDGIDTAEFTRVIFRRDCEYVAQESVERRVIVY